MQGLTVVAPFLGILGLIIAYLIYLYVKKQPNGSPLMQELEGMIHAGAMAFLRKEYSVLVIFIVIVFLLLGFGISWYTAIAFATGACCSMLAGFSGMTAATRGNSRIPCGPQRRVFFHCPTRPWTRAGHRRSPRHRNLPL